MFVAPTPHYSATLAGVPDGPRRNHHTLHVMRSIIDRAKVDPRVMTAAHSIIYLQLERDELGECKALFDYVRDHIRYVRDVVGIETLCDPAMTLQRKIGDCDDQTMLLCALLESSGYPTRLVMTGYETDDWEHVYCQVLCRGHWYDCDPIERGQSFGWAPPNPSRIYIEAR